MVRASQWAQREEGTGRAWVMARSTVSLEHGTIRGAAGDRLLRAQMPGQGVRTLFCGQWNMMRATEDPEKQITQLEPSLKATRRRDRLQRENGDSRILLTWIHLSCSLKQGTTICYENCPRHSLTKDINFKRNMEVHPPLF